MKQFNRKTGKVGEDIAFSYLQNKGYTLLERNFSNKFGEIDIIAKDGTVLVFVEVKTKIGVEFGLPEEMVGKGKLNKIQHMASLYMNGKLLPCRIDVIAIVLNDDNTVKRLTQYENVY